ncbi:phage holin [Bifidobacterium dentium]|uniref:phage holin n=1 Tax=Bifidobacterium dentium TaxID=1689 RepID=UPI0018B0C8A0|nr:phage holin [Bifidobacterium dentium]MBF9694124.1 phage holin [Bifidobacterium dentium]
MTDETTLETTLDALTDEATSTSISNERADGDDNKQPAPPVDAATIARTIVLLLGLANSILVMLGVDTIPIADETVNQLVALIWTIGASLWAWWKDNAITVKSRALHARK